MKSFDISKVCWIPNKDGVSKPVCPDCVNHIQGNSQEVTDCKNTFHVTNDEGKMECRGQCCCYSLDHGKRVHW